MSWRILQGDCIEQMKTLEDQSVNTCVTSPPYFGLRDYGTASWEGGDPDCEHVGSVARTAAPGSEKQASNLGALSVMSGDCAACGATRVDAQIGLEPTPDEFVQALVEVFRDVRRVLRDDGTVWLNLGDSYAAQRGGTAMPAETLAGGAGGKGDAAAHRGRKISEAPKGAQEASPSRNAAVAHRNARAFGLKQKDLIGIPWLVAFALRADGWYLRQDIIWHKPNPMPESVQDRCTKAHEYIFLLSKSKTYFYDAEAVAEDVVKGAAGSSFSDGQTAIHQLGRASDTERIEQPRRNKRSVWTVTTKPFSGAHFATFPPDLIEPCILAGSPEGGTVLDPFAGSGTTGMVALRHNRSFVGCELNPEYVDIARRRILDDAPLMNQVSELAA